MKQNKTMRRIFSLLLCLSMVLVYIPVSAFAVNMTGGEKLYLVPNSNWKSDGARFAAYFFNNSTNKNEWASMTRVEGETDIIYEVTVPTGNWTNVIFCRMNPSASANNWNNKWNQTADLTFDGTKNLFTVKAGAWDGATSTWSHHHEYTEEITQEPTCTAEGQKTLTCWCGVSETKSIPVIDHSYVDDICENCGEGGFEITVLTDYGTVDAPKIAAKDKNVVLTVTPNEGYLLKSLTVKFGEEELEVTDNQFTMPAGNVTVKATFREITDEDVATIYFQNNWLWTDVKIYYKGSESFAAIDEPGVAMNNLGTEHDYSENGQNSYEVYSYDLPADADSFVISGIKNDGSGSRDKTPDITEGFADGICYRMFWNNKNEVQIVPDPSVKYDITVEAAENGEVIAPKNAAEEKVVTLTVTPAEGYELASLAVLFGEEELTVNNNQFVMPGGSVTVSASFQLAKDPGDEPEEKTTMTVYFQNNWLWTDVNAYYWGSTTNTNPGWPGVAMTKVENPVAGYSDNGTYEVYSVEVPLDAVGLIINGVKNDGSGNRDQTTNITSFCDGICYYMYWDNANKAGAMISPEVAPETPVEEWSISLGDNIGVNFKVNAAIADHLEFSIGGTALTKQVTANGDGTSTVSVGLAAAQMADTITIKGCGAEYEKTYSVVDYAKDILGGEYSDETKALVTEMLNYGAAAQMHFQYNTENLVKEDYTKDQSLTLEAAAVEVADSMNGLGYYGASMLFRNKIAVRFYFTGSVEDCAFLEGENTYHLPNQTSDGLYYVEIENINPDALDEQITLTVTRGDGEVITVTYGPMNYIKRMYEKEDTSESLKDVLENLYHYHKAAVAYVESLAAEA